MSVNSQIESPDEDSSFRLLVSSFDPSGKQFEHFVKWFLQKDPEWATQVNKIWLWDEWPDRWGPDCGIDLVFQDKNGETWAVQAKQYAPNTSITKSDVDSFLSESNRVVFQRRLLIASTDLIGRNAKQACEGQEKPVVLHMAWNFENSMLVYPSDFEALFQARPRPKPTPRPYQERAIVDVVAGFENATRGQLIMACGTGKTFVSLWVKERLDAQTALILLPSLSLLSQTLQEWTAAANEPFEVLCVCSDETVGSRGRDEAVSSTTDVAFPVHSDPGEIARFLKSDSRRVVFSTYQSSPLIAEAQKHRNTRDFDLVVADEAHRCAGKVEGAFGTILDPTLIRASKRLFTTATPRTVSGHVKSAAEGRGIEMVGMDDETIFGRVLHTLSFGAAIQHDPPLLTDYRVIIIGVDDAMIADWIENRELLTMGSGEAVDAESLASQIGLLKAIRDYDISRAISFHGRVKRAKEFSEDIQNTLANLSAEHHPPGELWADYVSGEMPTVDRRRKLTKLKALGSADRGILSNARCLSEGVDVPALDGVAFIDPRRSQVDIVQAVGRAIRLSEGKTAGTIVLPVFIEDSHDAEASIESSRFKPVWDVLDALRAHDETLGYELDQIRTELGRRPGSNVTPGALSKIVIDLPVSVDDSFADKLRTVLVEQSTTSWEFWYGMLLAYHAEQGHCLVPQSYKTADGYRLGAWVSNQRMQCERLSAERRSRLEGLGFVWDQYEQQWEEGFRHLQAYHAEQAHCRIPARYKTADGYRLGVWVNNQRRQRDSLSADRLSRLEGLGFVWDVFEQQWEEGFRYLQAYHAEQGHCRVPKSYKTADGYRLGEWTQTQRRQCESLSADQRSRLEGLGFVWDPFERQLEDSFRHLQAYHAVKGHCLVPARYKTTDGYRLGAWVSNQRMQRDSLSVDRRSRLEGLGFVWDKLEQQWEEGFQYLKAYHAEQIHCRVPQGYKTADGYPLGQWVSNQRMQRDSLSVDRGSRLEGLGFVWDPLEQLWEEGFRHLQAYHAEQGHCRVPAKYKTSEGYRLGKWVSKQRSQRDGLSAERRSQLEGLGFVWDPFEQQWEEGFRYLQAYHAKQGHCLVPATYKSADGYRLGVWVSGQRSQRDSLSADRRSRLEGLGFVWDPLEQQWEEGFRYLQAYHAEQGHCRVPQRYKTTDGYRLGQWVAGQRKQRDSLSADRRFRLEGLGFVWDPLEQLWEEGFRHLQAYHAEQGDCLVPGSYKTAEGYTLGQWVGIQRRQSNSLSPERRSRLGGLGFVWAVKKGNG